jgi:hypothetical protein
LVYGPEAEIVAVTLDGAINEVQGSFSKVVLFLRKHRLKNRYAEKFLVNLVKQLKFIANSIKSILKKINNIKKPKAPE